MFKTATLLALLLLPSLAHAECDQDFATVDEYSYASQAKLARAEPVAKWEYCMLEAESTTCPGVEGLECAREMQRIYSSCVAEVVCDDLVQGLLEDSHLVGETAVSQGYDACVSLVMRSGGEY